MEFGDAVQVIALLIAAWSLYLTRQTSQPLRPQKKSPEASIACLQRMFGRRREFELQPLASHIVTCPLAAGHSASQLVCNPANPSRRYRSIHLRAVRGQTPTASATASSRLPALHLPYNPLSTARRGPGILVHVHPVLPRIAEASQLQLPRSGPGGQPNESSQLANEPSDQ